MGTGIDEAFHGKQTGDKDQDGWPEHDYESGLAGAIKGVYEDGEDIYKNLRHEVDWEKEMRDFRKAATDALFKDIGDAVDDVDFEPIKDTTLDFLKHTRDILQLLTGICSEQLENVLWKPEKTPFPKFMKKLAVNQ